MATSKDGNGVASTPTTAQDFPRSYLRRLVKNRDSLVCDKRIHSFTSPKEPVWKNDDASPSELDKKLALAEAARTLASLGTLGIQRSSRGERVEKTEGIGFKRSDETDEAARTDCLRAPACARAELKIKAQNSNKKQFPEMLMDILSTETYSDSITWLPDGKSFVFVNSKKFTDEVIPRFFSKCHFSSFRRKLQRWGFRICSKGFNHESFCHKLFRRDRRDLCRLMTCMSPSHVVSTSSGSGTSSANDKVRPTSRDEFPVLQASNTPTRFHRSLPAVVAEGPREGVGDREECATSQVDPPFVIMDNATTANRIVWEAIKALQNAR